MTADCYAILGVTPASEDVVIHAAYRALIRRYHPDANASPEAAERVRAINSAYAILRDPAKRAEYDSSLAAGQPLWLDEQAPPTPLAPARGRSAGIGAAAFAVALVAAVWAMPTRDLPAPPAATSHTSTPSGPRIPDVTVADLVPPAAVALPPLAPVSIPAEPAADDPPAVPDDPPTVASAPTRRAAASPPRARAAAPVVRRRASDPRFAALDRQSTALFDQSLANANSGQRAGLEALHGRFVVSRDSCRSDSCVTNAYLAHMREVAAIMEQREPR